MKKFVIALSVLIVIFSVYKAYQITKTSLPKVTQTDIVQHIDQSSETKKQYNKIKSDWPKGNVLGRVLTINEDIITIEELISWKCFYAFDYTLDENNHLSKTEIDAQYNTQYLPWCEDPSGGTLYEKTGKNMTFNFNNKTIFSITVFDKGSLMGEVSKKTFIQKVEEYKPYPMMVTLTLNGTLLTRVDEVYND